MVGKGLAMLYATDEKSEARKIMAKRKFYVVWQGIRPGVYSSLDDCKAQVSGVENARYKSFETREEAEAAFNDNPWKHLGKTGTKPRKPPLTKATYILESIAVDAACSGNPGLMEYRGVFVADGMEIFHVGPLKEGTNNIGEFLAIVHALALLKQKKSKLPIYSDSVNAIKWVANKKCNTKLTRHRESTDFRPDRQSRKVAVGKQLRKPIIKLGTPIAGGKSSRLRTEIGNRGDEKSEPDQSIHLLILLRIKRLGSLQCREDTVDVLSYLRCEPFNFHVYSLCSLRIDVPDIHNILVSFTEKVFDWNQLHRLHIDIVPYREEETFSYQLPGQLRLPPVSMQDPRLNRTGLFTYTHQLLPCFHAVDDQRLAQFLRQEDMFFKDRNLNIKGGALQFIQSSFANGNDTWISDNLFQVGHLIFTLFGIPGMDSAGKGMAVVCLFGYFKLKGVDI